MLVVCDENGKDEVGENYLLRQKFIKIENSSSIISKKKRKKINVEKI